VHLSKEEIKSWRSSSEKITLEEFAKRLGKSLEDKKESNDMYDLLMNQPAIEPEPGPEPVITDLVPIEIRFNKKLTQREEILFNYFNENRGEIVYARDLADILDIYINHVYKYIKSLREKLDNISIIKTDKGYVLPIV
jgi:hypothetical protein